MLFFWSMDASVAKSRKSAPSNLISLISFAAKFDQFGGGGSKRIPDSFCNTLERCGGWQIQELQVKRTEGQGEVEQKQSHLNGQCCRSHSGGEYFKGTMSRALAPKCGKSVQPAHVDTS